MAHVYTRPHQPATRFVTVLTSPRGTLPHWTRYPSNRLLPTSCCRQWRPAKNLTVQVFFDVVSIWCREGAGCRRPRRRAPAARILAREFKRGLTMLGLARKYGLTRADVERRIRRWTAARDARGR